MLRPDPTQSPQARPVSWGLIATCLPEDVERVTQLIQYLEKAFVNLNKRPIKYPFWIRTVIDLTFKAESKAFDLKTVDRFEPKPLLFAEESLWLPVGLKHDFL